MPGRIPLVVSLICCAALLTTAGFAAADVDLHLVVVVFGLLGLVASWVLAFAIARHHVRVLGRMAKLLRCENDEVSVMLSLFVALRKLRQT
jgi:hypothetical protein